ncbi:MAG: tRNA (adenosine(37)-N6)-dimethylallyltransferase MiaA [Proteobacteria bacterium]|nr:tRNA (adenosine(37)-N6)-dimethylallyltransferase MiaA [Pseudomonadota bacterium]
MNSTSAKPDVYCLMGPSASGKTALAVDLVARLPFQIISADSAQVYRGMDIGTGKPGAAILEIAPHRLIDIMDPSQAYSAADFRQDAMKEIAEVITQGDIPLLVGGTMLYFKVLRDGLAEMPNADSGIRREIEALAVEQGWEAVHRQLARVDPESAARIHPNDPQRLQRALEVFMVSGKSMTDYHREEQQMLQQSDDSLPFTLHFFAIQPPDRKQLHHRITQRFLAMLDNGLVDEVRALYNRDDLHPQLPSIKSVGYRQVWQHLAGDLDYDAMVEKSIIATRQLAKRQLTWLRSWQNLQGLDGPSANAIDSVLKYVDSTSI